MPKTSKAPTTTSHSDNVIPMDQAICDAVWASFGPLDDTQMKDLREMRKQTASLLDAMDRRIELEESRED